MKVPITTPTEFEQRGKRLQLLRHMTGLTMAQFAKKYQIGASTIGQWENGRLNGLSEKGAKKISQLAEQDGIICRENWLLHGVGIPPWILSKDEKIAQLQKELLQLDLQNVDEKTLIQMEINRFRILLPNTITLQVQDDGMEPLYQKQDIVGGQSVYGSAIKAVLGKICIVQTTDNRLLLRKILPDEQHAGKFKLCCSNPNPSGIEPVLWQVEIASAAVVTRLWRFASTKST